MLNVENQVKIRVYLYLIVALSIKKNNINLDEL